MYNFILLLGLLSFFNISAQTTLTGTVVDAATFNTLEEVSVSIEGTGFNSSSNNNGEFTISGDLPEGNHVLLFVRNGYLNLRLPVVISQGETKNLDLIPLRVDVLKEQIQIGIISLSDSELNEEDANISNVSGLLQATKDVFLNAAAFDFSSTFFRPRGLDSEYSKLLINGIEMNKIFNGRPQWSNWGGLNDVQRNQVFSMGTTASDVSFGNLAGTTNIIMRASQYQKGARISYALANRSYNGRIMGTYNSGELANGWFYSISASRRFAEEGFTEGTPYDSNSFFISVEKKMNAKHSLNFSGFYTPVTRGKSSANSQEVIDLKGRRYNSFWGFQDGEIRNSRLKEIKEPVLMLNHFWKLSETTELNTNLAYQFGKTANTRIDYGGTRLMVSENGQESYIGGGSNPDPSYYQKLPSYFLRFEDNQNYEAAYLAEQYFKENGQLDWNQLYEANKIASENGGNSIYVLSEDRTDDTQFTANSILTSKLNDNIVLNSSLKYSHLKSENFASVRDLLGGNAYLDIDFFAEANAENTESETAQSDLNNRNRLVGENERYKYNFEFAADVLEAFTQAQISYKNWDLYAALKLSQTSYQRNGLFKNGHFPNNSLGRSEKLNFTDFGVKAGGVFKLSGKHLFELNAAYLINAPSLKNSFSNPRENNEVVHDLTSEKMSSADLSYRYRMPNLKLRITGYFSEIKDATEISFYYADRLSGLGRAGSTAFVQEILSGIDKQYFGAELGAEYQITTTLKIKAAAALGQFTYSNNPELTLTSNSFNTSVSYGQSYLKNYRIAGGPQQAAQIGFEYRDPDYWWFGTTVNFFSHAFADIAPLNRTNNFSKDADGFALVNYDEVEAKSLLRQERFDDYMLVNVIGGKSWLLKGGYYVGFFVSINNILDEVYKTGGFEQSRNANFRNLKEDKERDQPIFGNKYWYGNGTTYYANMYVRF